MGGCQPMDFVINGVSSPGWKRGNGSQEPGVRSQAGVMSQESEYLYVGLELRLN